MIAFPTNRWKAICAGIAGRAHKSLVPGDRPVGCPLGAMHPLPRLWSVVNDTQRKKQPQSHTGGKISRPQHRLLGSRSVTIYPVATVTGRHDTPAAPKAQTRSGRGRRRTRSPARERPATSGPSRIGSGRVAYRRGTVASSTRRSATPKAYQIKIKIDQELVRRYLGWSEA